MYEQAIAELVKNPAIETVTQVAMPLLKAASFRAYQDGISLLDETSKEGTHLLFDYYKTAIQKAVKKCLNRDLDPSIYDQKAMEAIKEK